VSYGLDRIDPTGHAVDPDRGRDRIRRLAARLSDAASKLLAKLR
jgi:hypothetical protein